MFGFEDLRARIESVDGFTACPVKGCATRVPTQSGRFLSSPRYTCPEHHICIGKSTFEYEHPERNLLSASAEDLELLGRIRAFKRESRMGRERSEDALSWNVFRHLQASGRLGAWLSRVTGEPATRPRIHYWSFDAESGATWAPLAQAREAFGEPSGRGSEPDLVITTEEAHIWVEAKYGSTNATVPSDAVQAEVRYTSGGDRWYAQVVRSPFETLAVAKRRYELVRLWLLGSWAAAQCGKRFELVNLVRDGFETDVPSFATQHFNLDASRRVHRITWESVHGFMTQCSNRTAEDDSLLRYLRGRTLGYDTAGRLVRAFALD